MNGMRLFMLLSIIGLALLTYFTYEVTTVVTAMRFIFNNAKTNWP